MNEQIEHSPLCWVEFTKSSTKDGGQGYKIAVAAGCHVEDADKAYTIAYGLKVRADEATSPAGRGAVMPAHGA